MNLKDYGEIEVQQDLGKLLIQVQKELKKKMFPRKHRNLLRNDVEIYLGDLGEKNYYKNILGTYETIESEEHKHKFKHKIIINQWVFDEYKNGLYDWGKYKRDTKRTLKNTIAHELIHAYAYEHYEWFSDDSYGFHSDGSPIFLSMLVFLNIPSGHKSMEGFRHTELYKKIKSYDDFEMVEIYLINLYNEYEKMFSQLEEMVDGNKIYGNCFKFSSGDITGLRGFATNTIILNDCMGKANTFMIGANTDLNRLKDLVLSKINRNVFDNKHVMLECKNIEDKRNKLKLQSMDI